MVNSSKLQDLVTEHSKLDRILSVLIIAMAACLGLLVLDDVNHHPRTDDAEVFANFIGIAPQVEGPILILHVRDDQFVKKGDLLFAIDDRPYRYALERALSEQASLEGQIGDERRRIAALNSAVSVSQANIQSSHAEVNRWAAAVDQARADLAGSQQGVQRAQAEWEYANNNLHRIEPLLLKKFVTLDQVDKARSSETALSQALRQAQSQVHASQAALETALAQYENSKTVVEESAARHEQAQHAVTTLEPLVNQRGARAAAVKNARYNLDNCHVYAPFDARVTNLIISPGAYAHIGQQVFTLIDVTTWWAVGNFREGQLRNIARGMHAEVYVLSKPDQRFVGIVDSMGFGVTPDPDLIGRIQPGLPDVQRSLNWVHLASRYPVRVRVPNPPAELFRVGASASIIIRGG